MRYASIWKRTLAFLMDAVLVLGAMYGLTVLLEGFQPREDLARVVRLPVAFLPLVVGWLYFAVLESSPTGQTLGKKGMNIQVKHTTGLRLTFEQASLRWKLRFYLVLWLFSGVFVPPLWMNPRRQFLHDTASESLVLEKPRGEA
ncbi:RDD family protein [Deinococcus misasensis]|uniref:RDD family protein n=1 Tax=Deinococcus misasensis TaxID=392413 RepID=UPI000A05755B|nr:RDD family protein [Deinococcus misasensis]